MRAALGCLIVASTCAAPQSSTKPGPARVELQDEVEPVSGLGLFEDERAQSAEVIAGFAASKGSTLAPIAKVNGAWAAAATGQSVLTGQSCGRPLGTWQARRRWARALGLSGVVRSDVSCVGDGGCVLEVRASSRDDNGLQWKLEAPFDRDAPWKAALEQSVAQLAPPPEPDGGLSNVFGIGGLMGSMGPSTIQEADLLVVSGWPADHRRAAIDRSVWKTVEQRLSVDDVLSCLPPNRSSHDVLFEADAAGKVTRCEGTNRLDAATSECLCGRLSPVVPVVTELRGARWTVSLRVDRRDLVSADRQLIVTASWNTHLVKVNNPNSKWPLFTAKVEDPSIEDWEPGPARLVAGCFASTVTAPAKTVTRWGVWFDSRGKATRVAEQKGKTALSRELAECVSRVLLQSQAPCPSRGGLWAEVVLVVDARAVTPPQNP